MKNLLLPLILLSPFSYAGMSNYTGKINAIRSVTSHHETAESNTVVFKLNTTIPQCDWLHVPADSQPYLSILLMAKAQDKEVTVWHVNGTCNAGTIEMR